MPHGLGRQRLSAALATMHRTLRKVAFTFAVLLAGCSMHPHKDEHGHGITASEFDRSGSTFGLEVRLDHVMDITDAELNELGRVWHQQASRRCGSQYTGAPEPRYESVGRTVKDPDGTLRTAVNSWLSAVRGSVACKHGG